MKRKQFIGIVKYLSNQIDAEWEYDEIDIVRNLSWLLYGVDGCESLYPYCDSTEICHYCSVQQTCDLIDVVKFE
ncbi:MAG: hypothetical protein GY853_16630 [PVC group bacterium]|nr:hypothetical protein [PVC group bacterium]